MSFNKKLYMFIFGELIQFNCKESKYNLKMSIQKALPNKSLGVLMHPTCIPGGRVCGTFGKGAKEWIKKTS